MTDRLDAAREQLMEAVARGSADDSSRSTRPIRRTPWILGVLGAALFAAGGVAFAGLLGDDGVTKAVTTTTPQSWTNLYRVLTEPASSQDRLVVGRGQARRVVPSARFLGNPSGGQTAYGYIKGEELCLSWQDRDNGVGSTSCRRVTEVNPPAVVVKKAPDFLRTLVTTMVPDGATAEVRAIDGSVIEVLPVHRNMASYEGGGAFDVVISPTSQAAATTIKVRPGAPG